MKESENFVVEIDCQRMSSLKVALLEEWAEDGAGSHWLVTTFVTSVTMFHLSEPLFYLNKFHYMITKVS